MASRRNEIRSALVTVLQGINGVAPYETRPVRVYTVTLPITQLQLPCAIIGDDAEEHEDYTLRLNEIVMNVDVLFLTALRDPSLRVQEIDKQIADCERAIESNPTLGLASYGVRARVASIIRQSGIDDLDIDAAAIKVKVTYRQTRGAP